MVNHCYRPQRSFYTCVSVHRKGGTWAGTPLGPGTHPPGTRYTPPPEPGTHPPGTRYTPFGTRYTKPDQVHSPRTRCTPWARYTPQTRYTLPDQVHPQGPGTPPRPGTPHKTAPVADGTHPTGMHSCFLLC